MPAKLLTQEEKENIRGILEAILEVLKEDEELRHRFMHLLGIKDVLDKVKMLNEDSEKVLNAINDVKEKIESLEEEISKLRLIVLL